jgi:hypothetical protein
MLQAFQDQLTALGQQVREGQQAGVAFHEELRRVLQVAQTAQETARTAVLLTQGHEQQQPQQQHQQPEAAQLPPHERMGPPAAGPRAPKPKSPEEFDPARKRDVDTWLFQVDLYYLMFPEMTDAAKVLNCSTYLRGSAQTWWRHFASQHDRLHALTWEEFKEAFRSRWQIVNPVRVARDKISTLRQLGSVQDFTQRFLDLKVQIPTMTEEEAIDKYVRGLKPSIRRDLEQLMAREGDKSLEELIRFADRTDSIDYQARRYRSAGPTPMDLGAMADNGEPDEFSEEKVFEDEYEGEEGEFTDDPDLAAVRTQRRAKSKGKQPARRKPSAEETARRRELNLCYNCGNPGHVSRECPQHRDPRRPGRKAGRQLNTLELCALGRITSPPTSTVTRKASGRPQTSHGVVRSAHQMSLSAHQMSSSAHQMHSSVHQMDPSVHQVNKSAHQVAQSARRTAPLAPGRPASF